MLCRVETCNALGSYRFIVFRARAELFEIPSYCFGGGGNDLTSRSKEGQVYPHSLKEVRGALSQDTSTWSGVVGMLVRLQSFQPTQGPIHPPSALPSWVQKPWMPSCRATAIYALRVLATIDSYWAPNSLLPSFKQPVQLLRFKGK